MPQIYFTRESDKRKEMFFAEMPRRKESSLPALDKAGESSSCSADFISLYESLPDYLMPCLDYCAIITKSKRYGMVKDKMIRLLLVESLIPEKEGEIMDNVANNIIQELIDLGFLEKVNSWHKTQVPEPYSNLCLVEVDEVEFFAKAANLPVRAVIEDDGKDIPPDFGTLQICSLFLITANRRFSCSDSTQGLSQAYMTSICNLQYLSVLDLDGKIERLPEEVGDLVSLRYLGLVWSNLDELPYTLGNLQNLQTLDISWCGSRMNELPIQVLKIQKLRHLIMSKNINNGEIRVPKEIGNLVNLITLTGVYAGGGFSNELSKLTQLRELGVKRFSDDHATDLCAAITNMQNLISLSLEAEEIHYDSQSHSLFPDQFEQFSPPYHLQELCLRGGLVETPTWLASISNLTHLHLSFSNLTESPTLVLQFLPKLKHLILWEAYKATYIGKEFCQAGGFPALETLTICSCVLVDWNEIENGAFPKLRSLNLRCLKLRFVPEGLQNIATLEELSFIPIHGDLARRLKGEENYKIKNISKLTATFSDFVYVGSPQEVLQHA